MDLTLLPMRSDHDLCFAAEPGSGNASFELLARSRQLFGQSPLLAWQVISQFRHAHHLTYLEQPDPCWLDPLPGGGRTTGRLYGSNT